MLNARSGKKPFNRLTTILRAAERIEYSPFLPDGKTLGDAKWVVFIKLVSGYLPTDMQYDLHDVARAVCELIEAGQLVLPQPTLFKQEDENWWRE
jgi:hypothetical protein